MRSVVVVLPASMWAMMPMLRVFSSEYCRSTSFSSFFSDPPDGLRTSVWLESEGGGSGCGPPPRRWVQLPAIVRERLVGLRHLVGIFTLLDGRPSIVGRIQQLGGQLLGHAALGPAPGRSDEPAHREGRSSIRPY